MEFIEPILSLAKEIYALAEQVKANRKRCRRVCERVEALRELVVAVERRDAVRNSAQVAKALRELTITLDSALQLIRKYTDANWMRRVLNSSSHADEFAGVNERLNDAFQLLSGALQLEQGHALSQVFQLASRAREDQLDGREDDAEMKTLLQNFTRNQEEKLDAMVLEFKQVRLQVDKMLELMDKPPITEQDIRMIKPTELKYELPKKPFMETSTSEVYKGEFHGSTVAIKRYKEPGNTSVGEIRSIFKKEVETMRRFESTTILRMFGICVQDEEGPSPLFLIIMEYCEKGSLRQVLDSDAKLSWTRKARLCLDAAHGLYRLHHTEEKSKVHGCINSSKFLVADGYRVKLGGFELAKTETSLRRAMKDKDRDVRSLCYSSPQILNDINHVYNKWCEIYSFGIVLWEVATRQKPFHGLSDKEIDQKVCQEKYQEPLPDDCPEPLAQLVNACRAYDSFQRPTAGVLVDKLRCVVTQLEEQ